jgi:oligopeptide transport system substrate-binding protein
VQGDEAPTLEEGFAFYQQAGDIALEELPIMPMWSGKTAIAYSDAVGDVSYDLSQQEIAFKDITVNQ